MSKYKLLSTTKLGAWGFWLIIAAGVLVLLSMLTALLLTNPEANTAYNILGPFIPVFVVVTLAAIVVSWIAILKGKDRGVLLIIFASVITVIALFSFIAEIAENSWSGE